MIVEVGPGISVEKLLFSFASRPGAACLVSAEGQGVDGRFSYFLCDPVETSDGLVPRPSGVARGWGGLPAAPRWVGYLSYDRLRASWEGEAVAHDERPPPSCESHRWQRYEAAVRLDHATGLLSVEGDSLAAIRRAIDVVRSTPDRGDEFHLSGWPEGESDRVTHTRHVGEVLRRIGRGDVYQVNLARRLPFRLRGSPAAFFFEGLRKARTPFGMFLRAGGSTVIGLSPELALRRHGRALRTAPIKGTRPRGSHAADDVASRQELESSEKEAAELTMAVDVHRNDLNRVCEPGSVRTRYESRTVPSATVWSRVAEVVGVANESARAFEILSSVLPCGSVTGAPKRAAMRVIASLEPRRRGLYTGAYGYVGRDGGMTLAVAIRTAVIDGEGGEYWSGGGIVADSDPALEYEETRWKARGWASSIEGRFL